MKSYSERQHYAQKNRFSAVPLVPKALFLYHGRFSPKLQDRSVKIVGKPVKYHTAEKGALRRLLILYKSQSIKWTINPHATAYLEKAPPRTRYLNKIDMPENRPIVSEYPIQITPVPISTKQKVHHCWSTENRFSLILHK